LDERTRLLRVFAFLAIHDRDARRAFGREMDGDGAADAAISAGDQAMLLLEALRADIARPNDLGLRVHAVLVARLLRLLLRRKSMFLAHRRRSSMWSRRYSASRGPCRRSMNQAENHCGTSGRDSSNRAVAASVSPRGHASMPTARSWRFATRV